MLKINEKCDGCGMCADSCPLSVIEPDGARYAIGIGCNLCGVCAADCHLGAISKANI
jgi:ferredoxin